MRKEKTDLLSCYESSTEDRLPKRVFLGIRQKSVAPLRTSHQRFRHSLMMLSISLNILLNIFQFLHLSFEIHNNMYSILRTLETLCCNGLEHLVGDIFHVQRLQSRKGSRHAQKLDYRLVTTSDFNDEISLSGLEKKQRKRW